MRSSMSTSIQIAKECLQDKDTNQFYPAESQRAVGPGEGLEMLARMIDSGKTFRSVLTDDRRDILLVNRKKGRETVSFSFQPLQKSKSASSTPFFVSSMCQKRALGESLLKST